MTIEERAERAVGLRKAGLCNCAQAVAAVLCDQTELSEEQIKAVTAGFCGGMGTAEGTCGALVGAGAVAGLKTGGAATIRFTRAILSEFKASCGAVVCRDLKALPCPCEDCVRNAVLAYGRVMGLE